MMPNVAETFDQEVPWTNLMAAKRVVVLERDEGSVVVSEVRESNIPEPYDTSAASDVMFGLERRTEGTVGYSGQHASERNHPRLQGLEGTSDNPPLTLIKQLQ